MTSLKSVASAGTALAGAPAERSRDGALIKWSTVDSFLGNSTSAALTTHRPCPICGSNRTRTVLQLDQFQFYSDSERLPKRVDLKEVQCLDCFALYLNPCYSEYGFQVLFAEAGCSYGSTAGHTQEQIDWLGARGLLRSGSRFLDAGCYDGSFLARLPDNLERIGVDIDGPAIERGRRRLGQHKVQFIHGDFENFRIDRPLDTITMFHVLEHLQRPAEVLRNLRSMVHAGSRLVVEVPVLEHGITNDINGFFSIQHMTHFSRTSLQNCMASAGWRILESKQQKEYNGFRVVGVPAEPVDTPSKDLKATALSHEYFAAWHQALRDVEHRLLSIEDTPRCILWGGGAHSEFLYQTTSFFQRSPGREYAIVDSDPLKKGISWRGIMISSPDSLREISWKDECLVVSSYGSQPSIVKAAMDLGVPPERVIRLYETFRVY
jgi:2-polyprenyl-3-methyl-5-hydroxy-6-metoxy-1,4-benzoquinol methylase